MHRIVAAIAVVTLLAWGSIAALAGSPDQPATVAQAQCLEASLEERSESGIQGSARLCIDEVGVRATIEARELTAGEAYTVWFVYFDQPAACSATPCELPDVLGDDPLGVLARMDGVIADDAAETEFSGSFRDLRLTNGSKVHLPVFGHGAASATDNRLLARQLLTPQLPIFGAPAMGTVADGDVGHPVALAVLTVPNDGA